jgi:hypothetical protein
MRDWRAIARAHGLEIAAGELDRIAQPLEALEEVFRPLIRELTPEMEPAFRLGLEDSE